MKDIDISPLISWIFGLLVFIAGILNLFLEHPVPGITILLVSMLYFPPGDTFCFKLFGVPVPFAVKFLLGFIMVWLILGVVTSGI